MAEKTTVNVGRVQGAGIFKSKKETEKGIFYFKNLTPSEILPKTGDSVITPSGEIWTVIKRGTNGECVVCVDTGDNVCGGTGPTPDINVTATVDESTGAPQVVVTKTGTAENPEFVFAFSGLKGEREDADNYYTKSETDELIAAETEERRQADIEEAESRATADVEEAELRSAADSKESEARKQADADESAARETADTEEAETRQKADDEETRNRELMDSYLAGKIDGIDTAVTSEPIVRAAADDEIRESIEGLRKNTESELTALKETVEETYATKDELQSASDALSDRVTAIEDDYLTAADKSELNDDLKTLKESVEETYATKDELQSAEDGLSGRITAIENDYLTSEDKSELSADLEALEGSLKAVNTDLTNFISEAKTSLTEAIEAEKTAREVADADLQSGVDAIIDVISDYAEVDSLARSALQQADIVKMSVSDVDLLF